MGTDSSISKAIFVDEVDIVVTAGNGGNGCVSFRREKYIPHGGPDGGDGGNGGSVYIQADHSIDTLQHLAGHHHWKAESGRPGEGKNCHGRRGQDITILVPTGTIIYDADHHLVFKDLTEDGESVCVAAAGRGGRGNTSFKNSVNQAPREFTPGTPGEERNLHLELKLIADAGLVGLPNAGKSTVISRLSAARPKIAAYPFTTLHPCLGIVEMAGFRRFVMADLPGLIEGAHAGAGLGDEFLRHIERTKLIIHMVDISPLEGDPVKAYRVIRKELKKYSKTLAEKPEIVVANKMDLTDGQEHLKRFQKAVRVPVIAVSAATGMGLAKLTEQIWKTLHPEE